MRKVISLSPFLDSLCDHLDTRFVDDDEKALSKWLFHAAAPPLSFEKDHPSGETLFPHEFSS
jgi:hypothetical protein